MNLTSLISLVFPPVCVSCGQATHAEEHMCAVCAGLIKLNLTLFCGVCKARLPEGRKICHQHSPYLLGAATDYDNEPVRAAIHAFKFAYVRSLGNLLGKLLARYVSAVPALETRAALKTCIVVPMPLSPRRQRERGFNQSEVLAEVFGEQYNIPRVASALVKARHTKAQSETRSLSERRENIAGCFAVKDPRELKGKTIFLVDDVVTSGATAEEAAKELKGAGAEEVIALVVAKA